MNLRSLARAWNGFFFAPQLPTPVALYRILFGLLFLIDLLFLRADWFTWFGTRGLVSFETQRQMAQGARLNLFILFPHSDAWVEAIFWIALVSGVLLTIGLFTRAASIAVFVCLVSLHQRNLFILHSGDTLMRVTGFFLMFAPAGAAVSLDRLIRIWQGKEGLEIQPRAPWAQRMIQFETSLMYVMTFWAKSGGSAWLDGTALHYVYNLDQFKRFPLPSFLSGPLMVKLATWGTLAIEFSLGVLVWIKEFRYPILLAGVILHLSIEYAMNVPLFQWIVLATYVTFVDPADLARAKAWILDRLTPLFGDPVTVPYETGSIRAVNVIKALDVFRRIRFVQERNAPAVSVRSLAWRMVPFMASGGVKPAQASRTAARTAR